MRTVGSLFNSRPSQWGLRGDPYLWKDLSRVFRKVPHPGSEDTLQAMLEAAFLALTAHSIESRVESLYIERYAHGGISSGRVDLNFWRKQGFPLILKRFFDQSAPSIDA